MICQKLTAEAYEQTFQAPMQNITETAEQLVDIWPYVEAIQVDDLDGFILDDVEYVCQNSNGNYTHVLIATNDENTFLVIIIDVLQARIYGHHLLNLTQLYSLGEPE